MDRINVAIIGAGIGAAHLEGYQQLPNRFAVRTLCDLDAERAKSVVENHDDIHVETDFDTVLTNDEIDMVDICLPPHLHFGACSAALDAGKHVVCEKPLVGSLREADLLAGRIRQTGKTLTPVFQYRYGPGLSVLRALKREGLTGIPFAASVETHWNRDADYYANPWRGTWKGEQGGAVLGHAIHNHDLLCTIFGPVRRLNAFTATRVNNIEVEDCAAISFEMTNGAMATSSITLGASHDTTRLRFCFENLTAESGSEPYAPAEGDWTFTARGGADQAALDDFIAAQPAALSGFAGMFEALADRLQDDGDDAVSFEDGRQSLELVSAIYYSARNRALVELPLADTHPLHGGWIPED